MSRRPPAQLRVLLLAASPDPDNPVDEEEFKEVVQNEIDDYHFQFAEVKQSRTQRPLHIQLSWNLQCATTDVQQSISRSDPHIVHFYGHMCSSGMTLANQPRFHNASATDEKGDRLSGKLLADILLVLNEFKNIQCVILTGCSSAGIARGLLKHVPFVISTTEEIDSIPCRVYSAAWYLQIFDGKSVATAHTAAINQLKADVRTRTLPERKQDDQPLGRGQPLESRTPYHLRFMLQSVNDQPDAVLFHPVNVPRVPPDACELFRIPRWLKDAYVQRPSITDALQYSLSRLGREKTVVLAGLGGVGKSSVALAYVHQTSVQPAQYRLKAWFSAETHSQLQSWYTQFAEQCKLPEDEWKDKPSEVVVAAVKDWLERRDYWLLVFDNAPGWVEDDTEEDEVKMQGDSKNEANEENEEKPWPISQFLPKQRNRTQHILFTSRMRRWPSSYALLVVDEMEERESLQLLKKTAKIVSDQQDADVRALSGQLGHLALALAQAGSYIGKTRTRVKAYQKQLLTQVQDASLPPGDRYKSIIAKTWNITLTALQAEAKTAELPPLARILLTVCAYLAPDSIPRALLHRWLYLAYPEMPADRDVASLLLGMLEDYSMLQFVDEDNQLLKVHRMLCDVLRHQHQYLEDQPGEPRGVWFPRFDVAWCTTVINSINAEFDRSFDRVVQQEGYKNLLLVHMESLEPMYSNVVSPADGVGNVTLSDLLCNIGHTCSFLVGDYLKAEIHCQRALTIQAHYEPNNPGKLARKLASLGSVRLQLGKYNDARQLLQRALTIEENHFGHDHVTLASTLGTLGGVLVQLDEFNETRQVLQRALTIHEAHYGHEHVQVAAILDNLGSLHRSQRMYREASQVLHRALTIKEAHYGHDHVTLASTLGALGSALECLEEYNEARQLLQRALTIKEAHYGHDNVELVRTLYGLGLILYKQDELHEARYLLQRALTIKEAHYGDDHAQLASTLSILGNVLVGLGEYEEARQLLERALTIEDDTLKLFVTLLNLSVILVRLGDIKEARLLLQRALTFVDGHCGPELLNMPDLLTELTDAMIFLGDVLQLQGEYNEAVQVLHLALTIREANYGHDHFELATTLRKLGEALLHLAEYDKARQVLRRALTIEEARYGHDHAELVPTLAVMDTVLQSLGEFDEARQVMQRTTAIQTNDRLRLNLLRPDSSAIPLQLRVISNGRSTSWQYLNRAVHQAIEFVQRLAACLLPVSDRTVSAAEAASPDTLQAQRAHPRARKPATVAHPFSQYRGCPVPSLHCFPVGLSEEPGMKKFSVPVINVVGGTEGPFIVYFGDGPQHQAYKHVVTGPRPHASSTP